MPEEAEEEDVSGQTIAVLTVLVVIISVLGTLTVMNEVAKFTNDQNTQKQAEGEIKINIQNSEDSQTSTTEGGQTTLTITNQDGGN